MLIETESEPLEINGWHLRIRKPDTQQAKGLILLLHGWAGTERVMWIFARHFPKDAWIVAPRGLFPTQDGGFGWTDTHSGLNASIQDYLLSVQKLDQLISILFDQFAEKILPLSLVGFSQGTALSYAYGLAGSSSVIAIAGLSGFVPADAEPYAQKHPLRGVPVWIAHGVKDETVPVERARQAAQILEMAGAQVDICESDVGHKLGTNCFKLLEEFIRRSYAGPINLPGESSPADQADQPQEYS